MKFTKLFLFALLMFACTESFPENATEDSFSLGMTEPASFRMESDSIESSSIS